MDDSTKLSPKQESKLLALNIVSIDHEPVELCKILKFQNLVLSGGEAKQVIADGMVTVNGNVELRKRKKIFDGDIVEFNGEKMKIITHKD
ncbi:MAG: RNA-binding S4 domain-containing protein [Desulfamplus sp.]|nr:RNA-binding S4 domain-containing protein [Desulfamplus sp.]MBF0411923.1 RNA-binding S4 domain-containing protein [Desulfamplus sp.]